MNNKLYNTRYLIFGILLLTFTSTSLFSQRKCATHERYEYLKQVYPELENQNRFEKWLGRKMQEKSHQLRAFEDRRSIQPTYIIPVVVHVIHNGEAEGVGSNISDQQILSQIEVLNEDFRRFNKDTINTPEQFKAVAADTEIEFRLAKRDPQGLPTNGIKRVLGPQDKYSFFNDEEKLKILSYWPAEDYLNIWIINEFTEGDYIGYATYPISNLPGIDDPNYNRLLDGVVIGHKYFGSIDKGDFPVLEPNYDKGRTVTHEIGHFLGLRHVWGDGGCGMDDYCDDTPPQDSQTSGCPSMSVSCGSDDMIQNYMDYTHDRCMNLFTVCQKQRMITVLENSPRRLSLINSLGAIAPPGYSYDLGINKIINPAVVSCRLDQKPQLEITNSGDQRINQFKMAYLVEGIGRDTISFSNINLAPGSTTTVELPSIFFEQYKQYEITFSVVSVEGNKDANAVNDTRKRLFAINNQSDFIPYKEIFKYGNQDSLKWEVINPDKDITWRIFEYQKGSFASYINAYENVSIGSEDWLISPLLDFSMADEAALTFNVSYADMNNRNEILKIMVSTGCDNNFSHVVYEQFASSFAVTSNNSDWKPRTKDDWQKQKIDLSEFAGEENVRIAFVVINGNGNNLYLDDIEFFVSKDPESVALNEDNTFKIFPNPTFNKRFNIAFNLDERDHIYVTIFDTYGKILYSSDYPNTLNQTYSVDFPTYKPGIYFVQTKGRYVNRIKQIVFY